MAMFSSLSLFEAKFTLFACVRERKDRAAKDLDSRKTWTGDSSSVSEQSRACLRFGDGVSRRFFNTHSLWMLKLGSRGKFDMARRGWDVQWQYGMLILNGCGVWDVRCGPVSEREG